MASFKTQITTDGATAYWPFSETSGTTAADTIGTAYNGTYGGAVTLNSLSLTSGSPTRKAPLFVASSATSYVTAARTPFAQIFGASAATAFSIGFALRFTGSAPTGTRIFRIADSAGLELFGCVFDNSVSGQLNFIVNLSGSGPQFPNAGTLSVDTTYYIHFTWQSINSGTNIVNAIYVNGASAGSLIGTTSGQAFVTPASGGTAGFANREVPTTGGAFAGELSDVAYFDNVVLSSGQVSTQYTAWLSGTDGGIILPNYEGGMSHYTGGMAV